MFYLFLKSITSDLCRRWQQQGHRELKEIPNKMLKLKGFFFFKLHFRNIDHVL